MHKMSKDLLTSPMSAPTVEGSSLESRGETYLGPYSKSEGNLPSKKSDHPVHRNGTLSNGTLRGSDPRSAVPIRRLSGGSQNVPNTNDTSPPAEDHQSSSYSFLVLGAVFLVSLLLIFYVYSSFPNLEEGEKEHIKLPRNIQDAKVLGSILNRYKERYYGAVLIGVFLVYLFLQTFAIPGSIFLSILSGFLFPFWTALLLICFCSATGATFCYGLSWLVGKPLIFKYFPEKVRLWSDTVNRHRDNLLNYIIFLRITPFLPNWFINITSPLIGVPLFPFWVGTFIGVAAPSFVAIQAGTTLSKLSSSSDALSWTSLLVLIALGLVSLVPALFKSYLKRKFD